MEDDDYMSRPVRLLDFVVIITGFINNIARVFETLTGELLELSIYHSNHKSKTNKAWEDMVTDLETLEEDK
jgi:hypothetical protein